MYIALGLLVPIAALLAYASTRPDEFSVTRDKVIAASPARLFALLQDFHEWVKWSPWEGMDPDMQRTYEGSERGVGARYAWKGNNKVGEGTMAIREVSEDARVVIALSFIKPFPAENTTIFTLEPVDGGTRVTWRMEGKNNLMAKVFTIFMNMDAMVGKDFEKGLAGLDTAAHAAPGP